MNFRSREAKSKQLFSHLIPSNVKFEDIFDLPASVGSFSKIQAAEMKNDEDKNTSGQINEGLLVFGAKEMSFKSIFRSLNLRTLKRTQILLSLYFSGTFNVCQNQINQQLQASIPLREQFCIPYAQIPPQPFFEILIVDSRRNKIDILIRAATGELVYYSSYLSRTRKISTLKVILGKLPTPTIFFIRDQSSESSALYDQSQTYLDALRHDGGSIIYSRDVDSPQNNYAVDEGTNILKDKSYICEWDQTQRIINSQQSQKQTLKILKKITDYEKQDTEILEIVKIHPSQERILSFDFMLINICRGLSLNPQQGLQKLSELIHRHQNTLNQKLSLKMSRRSQLLNGNPGDHYSIKTNEESKQCKKCLLQYKMKKKKTKYICEGCSTHFGMEVNLCPECMGDFHFNIKFYERRLKKKYKIERQALLCSMKTKYQVLSSPLQPEIKKSPDLASNQKIETIVKKLHHKIEQSRQLTQNLMDMNQDNSNLHKFLLFSLISTFKTLNEPIVPPPREEGLRPETRLKLEERQAQISRDEDLRDEKLS